MKKTFAVMVLLSLILAGCESAFKLPAGCEEEPQESTEQQNPQDNVAVPLADDKKEETAELKEAEETTRTDNIPAKKVVEGGIISFPNLKARDPDGDKITYTFSNPLDANGRWQTKIGDVGEYTATITASDGKSKASQKVKLVVIAKNRPPTIETVTDITVNEGETIKLSPTIEDLENDKIEVTYSGWMDNNEKTTTFGDAGRYTVEIKASDGTSTATKRINIIVKKQNRAPELEPINDIVIKEGDKITVKPVAKDADNDKISFKFSKPLDAQGEWQTKINDAGTYEIKVTASDEESSSTAEFKVTVEAANRPPELNIKEAEINVNEGDIVTIHAEATDKENDSVRTTFSGWMTSDTYKTTYEDAGVHTVTVTATDGVNVVSKDVVVTVRNFNRAPVFDAGSFD